MSASGPNALGECAVAHGPPARYIMRHMDIRFSRHAQRRASLYGIPQHAIRDVLAAAALAQGQQTIVAQIAGCALPVKVVVVVEGEVATVVTSYPVARGRKP